MAKTKVVKQAKNQSSSDSSDSSDSSSDEAPATKVQTPKQTVVEKSTPKTKSKGVTEAAIPPKPVPVDKFPKRKAQSSSSSSSSSDSSDDEPPTKKANIVGPSPVKQQTQPAVNAKAANNAKAKGNLATKVAPKETAAKSAPKQPAEKAAPKSTPKAAAKEAIPPKPVPVNKFPKGKADTSSSSSSSDSSDDEPVVKKASVVAPSPVKVTPQPVVNARAVNNVQARGNTAPKVTPSPINTAPKVTPSPVNTPTKVAASPAKPQSAAITASGDEVYSRVEPKKLVTSIFGSNCPHCGHEIEVKVKFS